MTYSAFCFRCKVYAGRLHDPCAGTTDDGRAASCQCPCRPLEQKLMDVDPILGPLAFRWIQRYWEWVERGVWIEQTAQRLGLVRIPSSLSDGERMRQEDMIERAMGRRFYHVHGGPAVGCWCWDTRVTAPCPRHGFLGFLPLT